MSPGHAWRAVIACTLALGCRNDVPTPTLAAQLLHDEAEIADYLDAFPYDDYAIFDVPGVGRFHLDDNPAEVKQRLRRGQPWEPYLLEELEEHVVAGSTVLDVGAHIGSIAIPLARMVGPHGRVFAFEPQRKIFRELVYNTRLNDLANLTPLRFAAGAELDIIELDPLKTHDGRVKVGRGGDPVELRPLDSFGFTNVSVIKIDVEGFEIPVLLGAERLIAAEHPVIFIEIWKRNLHSVTPILERYGYSLRPIGIRGDYLAVYQP